MPDLEQHAVTAWLAAVRPDTAAHDWPPAIRAIETSLDAPDRLAVSTAAAGRGLTQPAAAPDIDGAEVEAHLKEFARLADAAGYNTRIQRFTFGGRTGFHLIAARTGPARRPSLTLRSSASTF